MSNPATGKGLCACGTPVGYERPALTSRDAPNDLTGAEMILNLTKPISRVHFLALVGAVSQLGACDSNTNSDRATDQASTVEALNKQAEELVELATAAVTPSKPSLIELGNVCRAAVAKMMGHPVSIMKAAANDGDVVRVQYNRPSDAKLWKADCRVSGDAISWRYVDATAGSGPGQWKSIGELGESMTFKTEGEDVTINQDFGGGSIDSTTYALGGEKR